MKLQAGDHECRTIWELLCKISRAEFQVLYDALGVTLTEVGESFYNPMIPGAIERLEQVLFLAINNETRTSLNYKRRILAKADN